MKILSYNNIAHLINAWWRPTPLALAALVLACGGERAPGAGEGRAAGEARPEAGAEGPSGAAAAVPAPPSGPVDEALADRGKSLFTSKGCMGCHTVGGGRLTGPDLAGVTARREYGWMVAMITNPDSMIRSDSTARRLFQEYMTPMMNVGVTAEEARALYEFLRNEDQ